MWCPVTIRVSKCFSLFFCLSHCRPEANHSLTLVFESHIEKWFRGMNQWGCPNIYMRRGITNSWRRPWSLYQCNNIEEGSIRAGHVCVLLTHSDTIHSVNILESSQCSFFFLVQNRDKRTKQISDLERGQRCYIPAFSFPEGLCTACGIYLTVAFISNHLWLMVFLMWPNLFVVSEIHELLWAKVGKDCITREIQIREEFDETKNIWRKYPDWSTGTSYIIDRGWNQKRFESRTRNGVLGNKKVWTKYQRGALQPFQGYQQRYYFKKFNTYIICPILAESKPTKNFHSGIILQED